MDKSFFPYGAKSKEFLIKRTIYLCKYLTQKGVDMIILACNTLSCMALNEVKILFKTPIIGVIDLFDFSNPTNKLFIGSTNTINYLKKQNIAIDLYDGSEIIHAIECNLDYEKLIKEKTSIFKQYSQILLGCTHLIKAKHLFKSYQSQDELYLQSKCKMALATPLCSLSSVM